MATECLYCNIVKHPRRFLVRVLDENDIAITGVYNRDIVSIYKKHGELPGGKNINQMTTALLPLKTPWEKIDYVAHDHYRLVIKRQT